MNKRIAGKILAATESRPHETGNDICKREYIKMPQISLSSAYNRDSTNVGKISMLCS